MSAWELRTSNGKRCSLYQQGTPKSITNLSLSLFLSLSLSLSLMVHNHRPTFVCMRTSTVASLGVLHPMSVADFVQHEHLSEWVPQLPNQLCEHERDLASPKLETEHQPSPTTESATP
jgi:hypothetical protein